jgi:hypothetical protein
MRGRVPGPEGFVNRMGSLRSLPSVRATAPLGRMSRTLWTLALVALGCRDVRVLPNDGGGGTTTVGGLGGVGGEGLGVAGGASPNGGGGAGGVGGEGPSPVPGCEQLVSAGEQVQIVVPQVPGHARLGALGDGRAGLTFGTGFAGQNATTWSLTVDGAFGDWPPSIHDSAQVQLSAEAYNYPGPLQTSEDGVFALNDGVRGFLSFDDPGVVRAFEEAWLEGFPRAQSEGGALIVSADGSTENNLLLSLATFSAEPTTLAPLLDGPCRTTRVVHEPEGGAFISRTYLCEGPRADFYRLTVTSWSPSAASTFRSFRTSSSSRLARAATFTPSRIGATASSSTRWTHLAKSLRNPGWIRSPMAIRPPCSHPGATAS